MESRVFTKGVLKSVNTMALVQGYNRAVNEEFLDRLPDEKFYVPTFVLLHEHKAGKRCDPHVRCVFNHEGDYFIIDVEMGCWDMLPTVSDFAATLSSGEVQRAEGEVPV